MVGESEGEGRGGWDEVVRWLLSVQGGEEGGWEMRQRRVWEGGEVFPGEGGRDVLELTQH